MELHKTYRNNITNFVQSLPIVNIKFLFFFSSALDKPVIGTLFSKFKNWFIVPGHDANYWYAYKRSHLQYLVSNYQVYAHNGPIKLFSVQVARKNQDENNDHFAYLGNHIDFSIHRNNQDVFVKSHWTEYTDTNHIPVFFTRSVNQTCNFLLNDPITTFDKFVHNTTCVRGRQNIPICNIDKMYSTKDSRLVYDLCKAAQTAQSIQTTQIMQTHIGKKGGAAIPSVAGKKKYKTLTPLSQEFIEFVANSLLQPLLKVAKRIDYCVYEYFDDGCILHKSGCKTIQYIIEFEEDQVIVLGISTHQALKACYASLNIKTASEKEKKCARRWMENCFTILNKLAHDLEIPQ